MALTLTFYRTKDSLAAKELAQIVTNLGDEIVSITVDHHTGSQDFNPYTDWLVWVKTKDETKLDAALRKANYEKVKARNL